MTSKIVNFLLYQTGWFACVLGAAHGRPWSGAGVALALIGIHLALVRRPGPEAVLVALAGGLGWVLDTAQVQLGLMVFSSGNLVEGLAPLWLVVLWMQFATLLRYGLDWMSGRYVLASALGAVGGPLAFASGARIGAVALHPKLYPSLLSLGVVWAIAMPALLWISDHLGPREGRGEYRVFSRPNG